MTKQWVETEERKAEVSLGRCCFLAADVQANGAHHCVGVVGFVLSGYGFPRRLDGGDPYALASCCEGLPPTGS
jgi:hypothetical protein